jgi:branched-chain amino acid transport system ATP-binding protein
MEFTVLENILIGLHMTSKMNLLGALFSGRPVPQEELERAMDILGIVGLVPFKDRLASELPHGHQRLLGVGIGLACEPQVLLLDEPVTGMNTDEKKAMGDLINTLHERGITTLLVEHDIRTVMDLCQRIVVLNFGEKIAEGSPHEIRNNQDVIEAYLGPEVA